MFLFRSESGKRGAEAEKKKLRRDITKGAAGQKIAANAIYRIGRTIQQTIELRHVTLRRVLTNQYILEVAYNANAGRQDSTCCCSSIKKIFPHADSRIQDTDVPS
jgi:hypothetical protein